MVLDWRDGDPYAISLALRSDRERRAYVSSVRDVKGLYFLACEITSRLDSERYHNVEADPFSDLAELAIAIAEHLGAAKQAHGPAERVRFQLSTAVLSYDAMLVRALCAMGESEEARAIMERLE